MSEFHSGVAGLLGIANENEFFSHYYLAEVFRGDTQETIARWQAREDEHPGDAQYEAPYTRLGRLAREWFAVRDRLARERAEAVRYQQERQLLSGIFEALGFDLQPTRIPMEGWELPVLGAFGKPTEPPRLFIVHAWDPEKDGEDPLALTPHRLLWDGDPVPAALDGFSWQDAVSEHVFGSEHPPRWLILAGATQALLIDRAKWPQNRLLRFDWNDILDRREEATLKATAVLLGRESLLPDDGEPLLDALDENAHKHATAVSNDLKYTVREAVELLGNEAARQLIAQARQKKQAVFSEETGLDAEQLTLECLRYMYRLLFLFYVEARPELGYVPIRTSDTYQKGYSLEMLRDLELVPLVGEEARNGRFLDQSIRRIFQLIHGGYSGTAQTRLGEAVHHSFSIDGLDSHLFDPDNTPLLNRVRFPNWVWQKVVQLMSLSRERARMGRGRVSYAQLGINQLGAVYEALLSYRGFFARTDLYEVKKAGETPDELEAAHFVPADEIEAYTEDERVYETDEAGRRKLRVYPKGTFIYRLAGRDREKSASYYTPEVLTRCLVKYALKELLRDKTADEILQLTVCEPAMGSAAFLNEAVNQLAQAYLDRKQDELGKRVPHDRYALELQRVKMYIADRNVFGVDLNPVAVELAEVSLWLNAISGSDRVPWFGYQLFSGNSLIGARREVYDSALLKARVSPVWHECAPRRVNPKAPDRKPEEVYHFLLPDPGMANYSDPEAKKRYPEAFKKLKDWRRVFCNPLDPEEIANLQVLSDLVDDLWALHVRELAEDRKRTEDDLPVWGQPIGNGRRTSTREKDRVRANGIFNEGSDVASAYRRLKLVMDYWCALWFWPLEQVDQLPSREQFWFEVGLLLRGNVIETNLQLAIDLAGSGKTSTAQAGQQALLLGLEAGSGYQPRPVTRDITDRFGQLHIERLLQHFSRLRTVTQVASNRRFFHWDIAIADLFESHGGFDLILGNPPWIKVQKNEGNVMAAYHPLFALRGLSATDLAKKRLAAFDRWPGLERAWLDELTSSEATQRFLSAIQNYGHLQGMQTNLYKCFIPTGWRLGSRQAVVAMLHPEGVFDDPNGGVLRNSIYQRLCYHFQFVNVKRLFQDVLHWVTYSINVYRAAPRQVPSFISISNLFVPATIDASFTGGSDGVVPGLKNDEGEWDVRGHRSRLVHIDHDALTMFASLYDDPGTSATQARLPALHSEELLVVLTRFAESPRTLGTLHGNVLMLEMWHETAAQAEGIIQRETAFPQSTGEWIISGPHIFVSCPFYKTARSTCETHLDYDLLDLAALPDEYVPRSNYRVSCSQSEYETRLPRVTWTREGQTRTRSVTEFSRMVTRRLLSQSGERTLIPCLVPPGPTHINTCFSIVLDDLTTLPILCGLFSSLAYDFFVKSTGRSDFRADLASRLPAMTEGPLAKRVGWRALLLNCLTHSYSSLWSAAYDDAINRERWTKADPRLKHTAFAAVTGTWTRSVPLRTDYERRQALVEIDVLTAKMLGLSLEELVTIYRLQFPVMRQNERDTWYDRAGRIVFSTNVGLQGIGLPRKARRGDDPCVVRYADGGGETRPIGWEDIRDLPSDATVTRTVEDDTLPGGPRQKQITYVAPFDSCDREADYRTAWKVFEERLNH